MIIALTRRNLRHALIRHRNDRIARERTDDSWPLLLRMRDETLTELLMDPDPGEARTFDFEGREFLGIPVLVDDQLAPGEIALDWPPVTVTGEEGVSRG